MSRKPTPKDYEKWESNPRFTAYAILTGKNQNSVLLDFDGEEGRRLVEKLGVHPHVQTASGGYHLHLTPPSFYLKSGSWKASRELGEHFPGLDIKGSSPGIAVAWGQCYSKTLGGVGEYRLLRSLEPDRWDTLPKELRDFLEQWSNPPIRTRTASRARLAGPTAQSPEPVSVRRTGPDALASSSSLHKCANRSAGVIALGEKRVRTILKLSAMRGGFSKGHRGIAIWRLAVSCKTARYSEPQAWEACQQLALHFRPPLEGRLVESQFDSGFNAKPDMNLSGYRVERHAFKNKTLKCELDVSESEATLLRSLGLSVDDYEPPTSEHRWLGRRERIAQIVKRFEQPPSLSEIVRLLSESGINASRETVRRDLSYLQGSGEMRPDCAGDRPEAATVIPERAA